MTWNYRVVLDEATFTVCEVYYDDQGKITSWSSEHAAPYGEDLAELRADLAHMVEALDRPVVEYDDLPGRRLRSAEKLGLTGDGR